MHYVILIHKYWLITLHLLWVYNGTSLQVKYMGSSPICTISSFVGTLPLPSKMPFLDEKYYLSLLGYSPILPPTPIPSSNGKVPSSSYSDLLGNINKNILSHGLPCLFPWDGHLGPPIMATLNIPRLTIEPLV